MKSGFWNKCSLALSLMILACRLCLCAAEWQSVPRGIYVLSRFDIPLQNEVFANPDVAGVFLRVSWAAVEPQQGVYHWEAVDAEIDRAKKTGKKVSFAIAAGALSPEWIYADGVKKLSFTILPFEGHAEAKEVTIPVPWDERFLSCYSGMVAAFAKHLRDTGRYDSISLVKINGINLDTAETRLPHQRSTMKNEAGQATDTPPIWLSVGYRPSLIIQTWGKLADVYEAEFPDKPFSLAIIPDPRGFPPINEAGEVIDKTVVDTTRRIVQMAAKRFGRRLVVQFNALSGTGGTPKIVDEANDLGACIAYQEEIRSMNKMIEDQSKLHGKANLPDEPVRTMFINGVKHNMSFMEISARTLMAYPAAVKYGKERLLSGGKP